VAEQVDEAAALIEQGRSADLEKAIEQLESLAGQDDSGVARFNLGVAYHRRGDLNRAMNQYQAVIATDPDNGHAWLYLGKIQEDQGIYNAAINNYRSGMRNDPENMALRVALIGALRAQGKTREAIDEAKSALKVNALSLEVYNNLGLAYLDLGDFTLAKFTFQKALQSISGAEQNAYLKTNLGWSYYQEGNRPAATKYLKEAVDLDKEFVPALVFLSRVYMDDHNYGDTVPLLETAAKKNPNNADVQLTLGVAYRGLGRLEEAEKAYEKALALDPANPAPHFNLGVLLGDYKKDYDGAIAAFNQYIASGGPEADMATEYIDDVQKEKSRAERRAKAEADRKKREEERKKREELLKQAEEAEKRREQEQPAPPPEEGEEAPAPEEGQEAPTPDDGAGEETGEEAPAPEEGPAPEEDQ
jgi:tetratricopeptide (TPR) repeat protein